MTNIVDAATSMAAAGLPGRAVIDGRKVAAASGETLPVHAPRDGAIVGQIPDCGSDEVHAAVHAARRAFEAGHWSRMAPRARKALLLRLADLVTAHAEELALLETIDTGKPIADTRAVDIPLALGSLRYYAEAIDKVYGEVGPSGEDRLSWAVHEPLGVIGAIVPWNFPLHMAMWKIAPALAMGNSVVVKPSELSSLTVLRFAELALEAGLPAGVLNIVPGRGQVAGDALARHMDVDMIAFTGSGPTGRALMRASADSNLKRVSLELGGKSPHIILADCPDLDRAATQAAWGIFYNQGQVCTAGSRLLVAREIRDAFVEKLVNVARTIVPGDPYDAETRLGAIISDGQLARVSRHVAQAHEDGGNLLLGGASVAPVAGGWYHEPTIFEVDRHATLAREEVFGPVMAVIEFDGPEQALEIANDTPFGLASGVWTASMEQANHFARRLRAGLVWVNGWDACDITMPFGGFKQSGFGRDRSLHALHKYADLKAVSVSFGS